jgi:ring-1,2-phenylacetyl-CoA epoxidase subunit PaaD
VVSSNQFTNTPLAESAIWSELAHVMDPEIPVLSLVAMKIIREVRVSDDGVTILMAPTFVGCPAIEHMKNEVRERLTTAGFLKVNIELVFSPPWSTDMLEDETKEKLRVYGIAPPPRKDVDLVATLALPVKCPQCGSQDTRMFNPFGATLCKQMLVCNNCKQPFERFKPV